jgi:hypothetical protein
MIELPEEQFSYGICPLMSIGAFVPVEKAIKTGQPSAKHASSVALIPCVGERCALWLYKYKGCCFCKDANSNPKKEG